MLPFISLSRVEHLAKLFAFPHLHDYVRMTSSDDVASYWSTSRNGYHKYIAYVVSH